MAETTEIKFEALTLLSVKPLLRNLRHWWLRRSEEHYLICAAVERERARSRRKRSVLSEARCHGALRTV